MRNYLKVDDKNRRLIMDRTFNQNRRIVGSKEYDLLQRAKADHPTYDVAIRHIKSNPEKQAYKHLTYEYMYEYVSKHPKAEERKKELDEMILRARCHLEKYGNVKKWFLAAYPDISDFTPADFKDIQTAKADSLFEVVEVARGENTELPLAS